MTLGVEHETCLRVPEVTQSTVPAAQLTLITSSRVLAGLVEALAIERFSMCPEEERTPESVKIQELT